MEEFDISSAFVQLVMAAVLVSIKIPSDRSWSAVRRMNRLLFACYVCVGVSNIATWMLGVGGQEGPMMWMAMLLVSMYQAMLFTATCVTFLAPQRVGVKWLTANAAVISLVSAVSIALFCHDESHADWLIAGDALFYSALLACYCRLFRKTFGESRRRLEESYDEDLSADLRWIARCFAGALTVGVSALLFAILRMGATAYAVFTCIYTIYYVYLVICVVNYRISAGFIVKVVAVDPKAATDCDTPPGGMSPAEELAMQNAIDRWVGDKRYIHNDRTVEEIAAELGTTHAMMKWYFTNRLHTSFRTWRLGLRIAEAKRLLNDEETATSAVHRLVGIADKSNFHKLFCKQVGMTPREYKESVSREGQAIRTERQT